MSAIATVRIEHEGYPEGILINESDYDPVVHALFGAAARDNPLAAMTNAELAKVAASKGLTVSPRDTKAALVAAIEAAG